MSQISTKTPIKPKPNHICEYCDKEFKKPSALEIHRRVHTGERPFKCNLCDYCATRDSHLQNHIRRHLKEKLHECSEPNCNYSTCDKHNLTKHHRTVHLQEKPFTCPIFNCDYKTGLKTDLTRHLTTHEENPNRPFKCRLCPYKAKSSSYL